MTKTRALVANMYWYLRAAMEAAGFQPNTYQVLYAYPDTVKIEQYPTLAIDINLVKKEFYQLSSYDRSVVTLVIDVLANDKGQKFDISSTVMDYFHENEFTLYDFTNNYPTNVGDYTGIPSLGLFSVNRVSVVTLHPPQFANVPAEKHHDMIVMDVSLPL